METRVLDPGLRAADALDVIDDASVSEARERVRAAASSAGLNLVSGESLVTAASELVRNQLVHASRARFFVLEVERAGVAGLEVVAVDEGPGIPEPGRAASGTAPSRRGMGVGLSGVLRMADEVDVDVRLGEGTCVRARKFAARVPYRSEVGVFGRPLPGQSVSGDDAAFVRAADDLGVLVADGLGHGPLAREASRRAVAVAVEHPRFDPARIVGDAERGLRATRGAVVGVGTWQLSSSQFAWLCVGNVSAHIVRPRMSRRLSCRAGVVGAQQPRGTITPELASCEPGGLLVVHTDGLRHHLDVSNELLLLREHPIVVAQHLMDRFAREDDDALVLVMR